MHKDIFTAIIESRLGFFADITSMAKLLNADLAYVWQHPLFYYKTRGRYRASLSPASAAVVRADAEKAFISSATSLSSLIAAFTLWWSSSLADFLFRISITILSNILMSLTPCSSHFFLGFLTSSLHFTCHSLWPAFPNGASDLGCLYFWAPRINLIFKDHSSLWKI